ncbi:AP2 [Babesia gibsoni]|uniref:AP2 n=1 Tax=Babesia gibsoni TaxID=33632 RepID=A0AAD8LPS7_BABGI|nr:AP2 [Babesia gibsoni]
MLVVNPIPHSHQAEQAEHKDVAFPQSPVKLDNAMAEAWKSSNTKDSTGQAYFFMYQMKLLNTLGLVKSVCRPWGTLPHGNDFTYHFNKIATTNSMELLQCYESVFRTIYDRFDAEGADPNNAKASLLAKVEDVDYFKVIYRLECLRHNKPFDNNIYKEMLERTMHNVELEQELEQAQGSSNFDEVPTWGKYNWESKNRQYSLSALDDETALPSDIDISDVFNQEETGEEDFDNSDLIYTDTNTIELEDVYLNIHGTEPIERHHEKAYNTRSRNDFDKVVMQVMTKQGDIPQYTHVTKHAKAPRHAPYEQPIAPRHKASARRHSSYYRDDDDDYVADYHVKPTYASRRDEESKRKKKKRIESTSTGEGYSRVTTSSRSESIADEPHYARNTNVVSASVSYDKRQQRFMAQWKTREGTKHSKSFYAKRYASPIMARKHAELYKMYILQHRGKFVQDMPEPTYEQLAAQNFEALESINITDAAMMDDFDRL